MADRRPETTHENVGGQVLFGLSVSYTCTNCVLQKKERLTKLHARLFFRVWFMSEYTRLRYPDRKTVWLCWKFSQMKTLDITKPSFSQCICIYNTTCWISVWFLESLDINILNDAGQLWWWLRCLPQCTFIIVNMHMCAFHSYLFIASQPIIYGSELLIFSSHVIGFPYEFSSNFFYSKLLCKNNDIIFSSHRKRLFNPISYWLGLLKRWNPERK